VTIDNDKDSNLVRVMKETTAGIEWKGRVDNVSKGGGGGRGGGGGGGREHTATMGIQRKGANGGNRHGSP